MQHSLRIPLSALSASLLLAACGGGGGGGGGGTGSIVPAAVHVDPASRMINVAWDAVGGASAYNVYVAASPDVTPGTYDKLPGGQHAPSVPVEHVRFEGLEEGGTYWAIVSAIVDGREGPASAPVSAILPVGRVRDVATRGDADSVRLVWASTRGASGYHVFVAEKPDVSEAVHDLEVDASVNSAVVGGLVNGRTYWFAVRAWNQNGAGRVSRVVPGVPDGRGTIESVTSFQAGEGATDVVFADLDLDGRDEMVVANQDAASVQTFAPGASGRDPFLPVAELQLFDDVPAAIGVLDANADGFPDLAVARRDAGLVTIHLGAGDGSFDPVPWWTIPVGTEPVALVVADLDGNGFGDVVVANRGGPGVSVALGQSGEPYFEPVYETQDVWDWVPVYDEWGNYLYDEYQVVGTEQVIVGWNEVDPDPFRPTATVANGSQPVALAAADVDGDADLDLLVVDSAFPRMLVLKNDGAGSFSTFDQPSLPCRPDAIAVGNATGYGVADAVLTARDTAHVLVLVNDGSGRYRLASEISPTATPVDTALADMNADGHPDMVVADLLEGEVTVLTGNGLGGFEEHFRLSPCDSVARVLVRDVDDDGFLDLVVTDPTQGCVLILFGSSS